MLKAIKRILSMIGKPIYFALVGIFLLPTFLVKRLTAITNQKSKKEKGKKVKTAKKRKKHPKQTKFSLKLEKLRLDLVIVKIVSRAKSTAKDLGQKIFGRPYKPRVRLIFLIIAVLITLGFFFYFSVLRNLPSSRELESVSPQVSTKIYDRNGVLLYKIYKDENRTIIPLTQIPQSVKLATLASEDAEFYTHPGFSIRGIFRALVENIKNIRSGNTQALQGGSTITQQLVKNKLLTPEKTLSRKIREIILSVEVEAIYTKDQILEMYLNEVSYGGTAYGIEEAAQSYFGKSVSDLSLAEAALLAGLPKSPTTFSPFGSNPELSFERQREVLHLMVINKYITQEQATSAAEEKLHFIANKTEIRAPHFVMYIRQILADKYGEDVVEKGGLEVTTSLDISIQETAEAVVSQEIDRLKGLNVGNGAALVVNPQTGEILAMVGSKDYFDIENDGNVNVLTSLRQPGSSIKVVNYAYALSNGFTPASIIDDSPITYYTPGSSPYTPVNYDGRFAGKISLRSALAQSRNVPAVKVLASYGVSKMVSEGQKMGITTWDDPSDFGLSLTLGGGAIKALDLARVYATLADGGKTPDLMPILEVKNYKGQVLEKNSAKLTDSIDARVAFLLTDILKDNAARAPEFGYNSYLVVKNHPEVAVKTGTSNDLRDNWTVGYNQSFLTLTWVGNNDNSPMSRVASGVTGASPIWNKIMSATLANQPSIDWAAPLGVTKINICAATGTLPCNGCLGKQEWFLDENQPTRHCTPTPSTTTVPEGVPTILDTGVSTEFTR